MLRASTSPALESSYRISKSSTGKRTVKKTPFVELCDGRIQGVISSGSDIERVYVAFIEAKTGNYSCSTNNNRPCGGLRGSPCKHILEMVGEAVEEFGKDRVAEFLDIAPSEDPAAHLVRLRGAQVKDNVAVIFSRFLDYLRLCEYKCRTGHPAEMNWF
jgi:hypothetical protein